jgi:hypothetical protein
MKGFPSCPVLSAPTPAPPFPSSSSSSVMVVDDDVVLLVAFVVAYRRLLFLIKPALAWVVMASVLNVWINVNFICPCRIF